MLINNLRICIFGTGYVGLVSGTCFAELGHKVICCDTDPKKITSLESGIIPIYEPGLEELVKGNIVDNKLSFSEAANVDLSDIDLAVIAVGTPNKEDGKTDLSFVNSVVDSIKRQRHKKLTVMVKSTVPLGTCKAIYDELNQDIDFEIDVVSNPEFLREGSAVNDFLEPERVVLGFFNKNTKTKLDLLYKKMQNKTHIVYTDCSTSELIKYASNAFLSAKVAFINEMSDICEKIGADVLTLSKGMGLDSRIGNKFLSPGPGFGGSCFPKDVQALRRLTDELGSNNVLISAIEESNNVWKSCVGKRIEDIATKNGFSNIHFLGVTYKANTDDVRSSAVIDIIKYLKSKFSISCYDPKGLTNLAKIFASEVNFISKLYECNESLIVVATEWSEFAEIDFRKFQNFNKKVVVDLRNIINEESTKIGGFKLYKLGRK